VTAVCSTVAAGDIVQNALRPSMRQPAAVRVARVDGRVRSWPFSLIAVAITTPSRAIACSDAPNAAARRSSPAATAASQRRTMLSTTTRCMFTPIATDASPRAKRLEATITSWTEVTPSPPYVAGIGAVK
jgi:hypothetical protein